MKTRAFYFGIVSITLGYLFQTNGLWRRGEWYGNETLYASIFFCYPYKWTNLRTSKTS